MKNSKKIQVRVVQRPAPRKPKAKPGKSRKGNTGASVASTLLREATIPSPTALACVPLTVTTTFSFATSAAGLGAIYFNPSLAWSASRLFDTTAGQIGPNYPIRFSSPATVSTMVNVGAGNPGCVGQIPSSGSVLDNCGHIVFQGARLHLMHAGAYVNLGGTFCVLRGDQFFPVEYDNGASAVDSQLFSAFTTNAALTTTHSLMQHNHVDWHPQGHQLIRPTEIDESIGSGVTASGVENPFMPVTGVDYAENASTCGVFITSSVGDQPFIARMTFHYLVNVQRRTGASTSVAPVTNNSMVATPNPNIMAKVQTAIAKLNLHAATTGNNPSVSHTPRPPQSSILGNLIHSVGSGVGHLVKEGVRGIAGRQAERYGERFLGGVGGILNMGTSRPLAIGWV